MESLYVVLNVITAVVSVYFSYLFISLFALKKTDKWYVNAGVVLLAAALFFIAMSYVRALFPRMLLIMGLTVMITLLFRTKWYNRILLAVVIYALNGVAEIVVSSSVSAIFAVDMASCFKGGLLILGIFMSKMFEFIIISLIRIRKHKLVNTTFQRSYIALFIIPLSTFFSILLQYSHLRYFPEISALDSALTILCYSLLLVANILVFNILDRIYNSVEKDYKLATSEKLIALQEDQYRQLLEHNQTVLKIKHDQKNFLLGVLADLDSQNYDDIRLASEHELNALSTQSVTYGQNNVIYSLVNHKTRTAAEKGVTVTCEYHELQRINISPIDVAIILGNALDNAIEAAEKTNGDKTVTLLIKVHNDQIVIIIKNPVSGAVDVENLKSEKNSMFHGFGITGMKNLAHAHNGEVLFTTENNVFQTHIILCNVDE